MNKYDVICVQGEGAYGVVLRCRNKKSGELVAVKQFKGSTEDEIDKKATLREVKILRELNHPNIVNLLEAFKRRDQLFLVFEYCELDMLAILQQNPDGIDPEDVRFYMWQLCRSLEYLHRNGIIHRDVKPENLLVCRNKELKICDFGFARYTSSKGDYTDYVATRWYRAPELLLSTTNYTTAVDIWAMGCIMGELLDGQPMFPGDSDLDQLHVIQKVMGPMMPEHKELYMKNRAFAKVPQPNLSHPETLDRKYFGHASKRALQFMKATIRMDPKDRLTAAECLKHPYFEGMEDLHPELATNCGIDIVRDRKNRKHAPNPLPTTEKPSDSPKDEAPQTKKIAFELPTIPSFQSLHPPGGKKERKGDGDEKRKGDSNLPRLPSALQQQQLELTGGYDGAKDGRQDHILPQFSIGEDSESDLHGRQHQPGKRRDEKERDSQEDKKAARISKYAQPTLPTQPPNRKTREEDKWGDTYERRNDSRKQSREKDRDVDRITFDELGTLPGQVQLPPSRGKDGEVAGKKEKKRRKDERLASPNAPNRMHNDSYPQKDAKPGVLWPYQNMAMMGLHNPYKQKTKAKNEEKRNKDGTRDKKSSTPFANKQMKQQFKPASPQRQPRQTLRNDSPSRLTHNTPTPPFRTFNQSPPKGSSRPLVPLQGRNDPYQKTPNHNAQTRLQSRGDLSYATPVTSSRWDDGDF
ncbi:putative Mitogen-activated protein kinase [Blattamonas nauphoetae]|uniref:Mitogen-activated protein kinase n=1 Tax=Blattamonas nauphoetae TaxID=2049346 RepID=A0ABQ9YFB7_9EUKA|nr:putative Mitogen-activated protein kinase [Blattamonas nauphoetae]